jgi:outer membrane protein insertion porin family
MAVSGSNVTRGQTPQPPLTPSQGYQAFPPPGIPQPNLPRQLNPNAAYPNQPYSPPPNYLPPPNTGPPLQTVDGQPLFDGPYQQYVGPPPVVPNAFTPLPPAVDFDVYVEETRTGRFMFGMGVNSNLGVTGQITVDERNFDWRRFPTSFQDVINGTAWRGAGQGFRLEAMPGSRVQRYLASFTQPYLYLPGFADPFSLNLSGYFYDRRYFDWDEQRLGGRLALGYRVTHDLSLTTAIRAENVNIHDPRIFVEPQLNEVLGDSGLFSGGLTLTHDTRDTAFAATEGHLVELSFQQAFGSFDYPRAEMDYRQYFLMRERPDGSGRHTLSYSFRLGVSGAQTPIYENYFAGGYSTIRGFDFRGASPLGVGGVTVGGAFQFLGSVEYMFPLTADDMIKGVVFCDYGTVEEDVRLSANTYRVSPGAGLRIAIPALGPAPLALDLAFPVANAPFDDIQNFSFFLGFGR